MDPKCRHLQLDINVAFNDFKFDFIFCKISIFKLNSQKFFKISFFNLHGKHKKNFCLPKLKIGYTNDSNLI